MRDDGRSRRSALEAIQAVPALVEDLYAVVKKLEALFPGRHFTPDGHLVGSIGEVLAAYHYGLRLYGASNRCHDGKCIESGREVQVKATQGDSVGLGTNEQAEFLVVLRLDKRGSAEEFYNGPGALAWIAAGKPQKTGQRPIRLSTLRRLMADVPEGDRIATVRPFGNRL